MLLLFLLMSKGGERLFVLSLCCRTHFGHHKKKGRLLKGGACSTQLKTVLMMSKAMHHVHHWFRLSPDFLYFALGVIDKVLHVKQVCIKLCQPSNS